MPESPLFGVPMIEGGSDFPTPDTTADAKTINDMFKYAEEFWGAKPVSSGSLPSSPKVQQLIFETDTKRLRYWSGSEWVTVYAPPTWAGENLLLTPSVLANSGGSSNQLASGAFTFSNVSYVRAEGVFPEQFSEYEVIVYVDQVNSPSAGWYLYMGPTEGGTHRSVYSRRMGFGPAAVVSAAAGGPNATPQLIAADGGTTGHTLKARVSRAASSAERTRISFEVISDTNNGEWFQGVVFSPNSETDTGFRIGVTSGTMTGRAHVRQIGKLS